MGKDPKLNAFFFSLAKCTEIQTGHDFFPSCSISIKQRRFSYKEGWEKSLILKEYGWLPRIYFAI